MKRRKVSTSVKQVLPTPDSPEGLLGFHQDLVIERLGNPTRVKVLGKDDYGMVVKWFYKEYIFTFGKTTEPDAISKKPVTVYIVTKVERRRNGRRE